MPLFSLHAFTFIPTNVVDKVKIINFIYNGLPTIPVNVLFLQKSFAYMYIYKSVKLKSCKLHS